MKNAFKTNKIFLGIIVTVLVIGGAIYFGFREFVQMKNQLASLQGQVALLLEEPMGPATSTLPSDEPEAAAPEGDEPSPELSGLEPEPEEPENDVNPCDYLNCDDLDGWTNSGSTFTCQDEHEKTCTCQKQIYHNYSCSSLNQKCVYSTTNTRTYKYDCVEPATQYPDLVFQSPAFSPAVPVAGDQMFFWATLKNQGKRLAVSSLSYLRINGVKIAEFSTVSLVSNESIVVAWATAWLAVVGQHELEVCADGALAVAESNELNNCAEITFTVAATFTEEEEEEEETTLQPDLIIESLSISPASTTAGQEVFFSGVVKNQGGASAGSSHTWLNIDLDNNGGTWDILMGAMPTQALGINTTTTISWQGAWTAVAGTHKFEICADSAAEVAEFDETNNCLSRVVTIPL